MSSSPSNIREREILGDIPVTTNINISSHRNKENKSYLTPMKKTNSKNIIQNHKYDT